MRKLVLGILALVSIQFAFVTYMMVLQSPMELTIASAPPQPVPQRARIEHFTTSIEPPAMLENVPSVSGPPQARIRHSLSSVSPERSAKQQTSAVTRISKPAFGPTPSKAATPVAFETIVISYDRNPKILDCGTPDPPKTKKRSYLAKASPVVKKPWEWIKTVASKLN